MKCELCGVQFSDAERNELIRQYGEKWEFKFLCDNCLEKKGFFIPKIISSEYISKIYGGVLGKLIGVRFGNPVEFACSSAEMQKQYPFIDGYLDKTRRIYTDDDTNGFVFFAKLFEEIQDISELTPELAANLILNYAAENRGFFWWAEDGTESMAFHHLLNGVAAEQCGDEQHIGQARNYIGGQIYYDAIGLIFAGRPELAAECAGIVAGVMHNGEGALGGKFICACESAAFEEKDIQNLIQIGLAQIPEDSEYAVMVRKIIAFWQKHPYDWRACQHFIEEYYHQYFIWDYTASIIMALLYGNGDFSYSMEICVKSAGDTDCNCGNLGCILGIYNGAEAISYEKWIEPIKDVLYCSSTVPYENEVSVTQLTAQIIKLYCKFSHRQIPEYLQRAAEFNIYAFVFPYAYQNMTARLWRNNERRTDLVNRHNSLWMSAGEVTTPSGSPYALKFWAWNVKANDCLRVYRWFNGGFFDNRKYEPTSCTRIFPGQKITVNVMTYDNNCEAKICMLAYSSQTEAERRSEYQILKENVWTKLELQIPHDSCYYDCINIELVPQKDSHMKNDFDGIAIYLDELVIEQVPDYTICYNEAYPAKVENQYSYPVLQHFCICYGEAYAGWGEEDNIWYNYCRFYHGKPERSLESDQYRGENHQILADQKNFSMAITGAYLQNYTAYCCMSVIPKGENPEIYLSDKKDCAALLAVAVKGANTHYAVGFWQDRIAVLKSGKIPSTYETLYSEPYDYDMKKQYYFQADIYSDQIYFTVSEINASNPAETVFQSERSISCPVKNPAGCIGFVGIGNGITIYQYGIRPV